MDNISLRNTIIPLSGMGGYNASVDRMIEEYIEDNWYDSFFKDVCDIGSYTNYKEWALKYEYAIQFLTDNPRHERYVNDKYLQDLFGYSEDEKVSIDQDFCREAAARQGNDLFIDNLYHDLAQGVAHITEFGKEQYESIILHYAAIVKRNIGHNVPVPGDFLDFLCDEMKSFAEGNDQIIFDNVNRMCREMEYRPEPYNFKEKDRFSIGVVAMAAHKIDQES